MKQVILIHGLPDEKEIKGDAWPSPSNSHWFPWIQKQLTKRNIVCQTLEMPRSYDPVYEDYDKVLSQMTISEETILVGHSCGGGFLLRYFSEHKDIQPKKLILVAPWVDPENYLKELNPHSDFFNFEIDPALTQRTIVECMHSLDDESYIVDSVEIIQSKLPDMTMYIFNNKGHFTEPDLGSKELPELLELILK